jgi:triosephosphate isomerase
MTKRLALVAANWKMNGTLKTIRPLVQEVIGGLKDDCHADIAICPPSIYLQELQTLLTGSRIGLGAQNASHLEAGAYTGEISVNMLKDYNCQYVIVGHSERREFYHETDDRVAEKFIRVSAAGMIPILCIGEQLSERESGETDTVIARQLDAVINMAGIDGFKDAVIAYEPVWAIGTGKTATPQQAQEVHAFIRLQLARHDDEVADKTRILYGGSVKPSNAADLFSMADIDGGLIGGASLVAADFLNICLAAG